MPEQPGFEVDAFIPDDRDARDGAAPEWCDLGVGIVREGSGNRTVTYLTRAAGEALITAVHEVLHPNWNNHDLDVLWHHLDIVTARLMDGEADEDDRGRAQGLAAAIAVCSNRFAPDIDAVREAAVERYEASAAARSVAVQTCEKFGHLQYSNMFGECSTCGRVLAEADEQPFG